MSNNFIAGHGVQAAVTLNPTTAPTVFTAIQGLTGSIDWGWTHETAELKVHNSKVDIHTTSPVLARADRPMSLAFDHSDTTHIALQNFSAANTRIGMRFTAPGATVGSNVDEVIESGTIKAWVVKHPEGAAARMADMVWRPSGAFIIDGVVYDLV